MSDGVEWATHTCVNLAVADSDDAVPNMRLASLYDLPPAYLNKHLQALAKNGIVTSTTGPRGGFRLARDPRRITLLDIVEAIEGPTSAFQCSEIRQRGPLGDDRANHASRCAIAAAFDDADGAWRRELARTTIGDLAASLQHRARRLATETQTWLTVRPPERAKR